MFEYDSFVFCCISSVAIYWNSFIAGMSFFHKNLFQLILVYKCSGKIFQDLKCAAMLSPPASIFVALSFNRASSFTLDQVFFSICGIISLRLIKWDSW